MWDPTRWRRNVRGTFTVKDSRQVALLPGKDPWKVLRGYWFEVSGDKWYPLEERDYTRIEEEHRSRKWRLRVRIVGKGRG